MPKCTLVSFDRSDGTPSAWPDCGARLNGGSWEMLSIDDEHTVKFLGKLAVELPKHLRHLSREDIRIECLPEGYRLFSRATRDGRQDRYLKGSRNVKQFRSPAEFAPHAAWLLVDGLDLSNCKCKYCSRNAVHSHKPRGQRDRSETPATVTSLSSYNACHSTSPISRRRISRSASTGSGGPERHLGSIRRQPSLRKISPQQGSSTGEVLIPSQSSDLVALSHGRLYRNQELVWLVLAKPLLLNSSSRLDGGCTLRFWPGVVKSVASSAPSQQTEGLGIRYLITIVSIGRSYLVPHTSIIPFRAYSLNEDILSNLQSLNAEAFNQEFDPLPQYATPETTLTPHPSLKRSSFESFIADIKIAKHIATTWTVTDGHFLADQLTEESTSGAPPPNGEIASPQIDASQMGPPPPRRQMKEAAKRRYRGLWWGVERIWLGDLLLLSFPERSIKYSSEDSNYFVHDSREDLASDTPPDHRKPEEKCVFFKLRALETLQTGDGSTELEAAGSVYRLAPLGPTEVEGSGPSDGDLPRPPDGFVFKAVLSTGFETRLPLRFIRGRYYPRVLSLLNGELLPIEEGLKAMEGLCPLSSVLWRPSRYTAESRHEMLDTAQDLANGGC